MDSSKLSVKLFLKDPAAVHAEAFVPVFHRWIQQRALPNHQLIDVADYKHVQNGPGTVLVAHEANLATDASVGPLGLQYLRKQPLPGDLPARLRQIFLDALTAARLLEQDPAFDGKLSFRTDNPIIRIHDRLHAPNTPETFTEVRPAFEQALSSLYGHPVKLSHDPNEETLFEVKVTASASPSVADLLARAGSPAT